MKPKMLLTFAAAAALSLTGCQSGNSNPNTETEELRQQIEQLTQQIQDLEDNINSEENAAPENIPPAPEDSADTGVSEQEAAPAANPDPEAAARIHPNDEKRIVRALEVWLSTGKTISQHDKESKEIPDRYAPLTISLNFKERPHLWERIDRRVDEMMARGLEGEVRRLLADGVPQDCTAMQAIGYKEIAAAILEGRPVSQGAEEVKLRSRQYAKRQRTWFRRNQSAHWFEWEKIPDFSAALAFSTELVTGSGLQ